MFFLQFSLREVPVSNAFLSEICCSFAFENLSLCLISSVNPHIEERSFKTLWNAQADCTLEVFAQTFAQAAFGVIMDAGYSFLSCSFVIITLVIILFFFDVFFAWLQ